ncbi:SMI1/KNR4 family protein [Paenibacillus algorifonticola]|uniref:SMI1/KNR4 family protein n=1 Tax=Paenibacillus algorifonticola TaxID=684063 RepID=UPI003D2DF928
MDISQQLQDIHDIEQSLQLAFPAAYKAFMTTDELQSANPNIEYNLVDFNGYTAWGIRFIKLDASYAENLEAIAEVVLQPRKLIPFAWSISSGDWLIFDYRESNENPSLLYIDHEMALCLEDAESEAQSENTTVEEMMEGNLSVLCENFEMFHAALKLATDEADDEDAIG